MKKIYTLVLSLVSLGSMNAQVIFSSSFESWSGGAPIDWIGVRTNLEDDSIMQITTGTMYGSSAVQLTNTESTHKRFSTQDVHTDSGVTYNIKAWIKGDGDVRAGLYDARPSGGTSGYSPYSSYSTISSSTWQMYSFTVSSIHTNDSSQFILSTRNTSGIDQIQIDSFVVTVGTAAPVVLRSVYDIQYTTNVSGDSPLKDSMVSVTGVVTAVKSAGYYIQDDVAAWSGIYVFDSNNTPAVGDSVTISASVDEYFNTTQLELVTSFVNHGARSIGSVSISTGDVNTEPYEGVLVTIDGTCSDANTAANFGMWKVNDGSGIALVDDQIFAYIPTLNSMYNVTGVVDYSFSEYKVLPRTAADVLTSTGISSNKSLELAMYPNPVKNILTIENANNAMVRIYNVLGAEVFSSMVNQVVDMSSFENGVYIVEVTLNNVITRKQVIKN